jgi:hypothetical protein
MMIKSALKLVCSFLFLLSSSAFAGIITTDLTEDTYFSYGGYDWTWASPVNVTNYEQSIFGGLKETNTFESASFHVGWMEIVNSAEHPDLVQLFWELTLANFTDASGNFIHSVRFWNSDFDTVNANQFANRKGAKNLNDGASDFHFETFYVRTSLAPVASVPEPTTLFIFGTSLLGLAIRKRITK